MTDKPSKYSGFFESRHGKEDQPAEGTLTDQPAPEPAPVPLSIGERRRGRPGGGKSANPRYMQVSGYIPREVYANTQIGLQKESIKTGKKRDFSDLLEELLTAWNERNS